MAFLSNAVSSLRALDAIICGADEAGRGPLAGPVVCAAVILNPNRPIEGLRDSKQLNEAARLQLRALIIEHALSFAVVEVDASEIDRINILQASLIGMKRAIEMLAIAPTLALIDGNKIPKGLHCEVQAIVKGDQQEACIAAASILAKTTRDARMLEFAQIYPGYGLEVHKGYPTPSHLAALRLLGASAIHRRSFAPVRNVIAGSAPEQHTLF
jgi:ribonuclease HII